ncbi:MAG: hypothetical protein ACXITV_01925 [Luteibaculaceae bacterium]
MKKKKIVLLLSMLSLAFMLPFAAKSQGISVGPIVTINWNSVDVNTAASLPGGERVSFLTRDARAGFSAGGFLKLASERWYIQPELLFTQANTDLTISGANITTISNLRYNMMEVPVKIGWQPTRVFRLFTGLIYYEVLDGNLPISVNNVDIGFSSPEQGQLSYMFGAGFDLGRIVLGLRYDSTFRRFDNGVIINGETISFGARPNIWRVAIAYKLLSTERFTATRTRR